MSKRVKFFEKIANCIFSNEKYVEKKGANKKLKYDSFEADVSMKLLVYSINQMSIIAVSVHALSLSRFGVYTL